MKITITITILLLALLLCVGNTSAQGVSVVTGKWVEKTEKVNLYKVDNGNLKEIASSMLDGSRQFVFAINQSKEGFYVIGESSIQKANNYTFYLKPGDKLDVEIDNANFDYKLIGDNNSAENKELKRWFDLTKPVDFIAHYFHKGISTYVEFFPLFEDLQEKEKSYSLQEPVSKEFEIRFLEFKKNEMLHAALALLFAPRPSHPKAEEYIDYYKTIDFKEITSSDRLLNYPYGTRVLSLLSLFRNYYPVIMIEKLSVIEILREDLSLMGNDVLKGEKAASYLVSINTYEELLEFNKEFEKYLVTDYQKQMLKLQTQKLAKLASGVVAVNFKFKDRRGKEVALSDFIGKVVYVDVWATWCGPCLKEAPDWKVLTEKYKGKDVVFLGVSIDKENDHGKWLKYLDTAGEVGVQLFAGENSDDIMIPYGIRGIPHLFVIGKDGKIVSANAPRPSSKEIIEMLDSALGI